MPATAGCLLRVPVALSFTLAVALLAGCPRPGGVASGLRYASSLEGASAAAKARDWRAAYEIYARHFLRDAAPFERNPELYLRLLESCFGSSRYKLATVVAKRFAVLRPADPRIFLRVKALTLHGAHAEAVSLADRYLASGVGSKGELAYWRSKALFAQGRYQQAGAGFQQAGAGAQQAGGDASGAFWQAESLRRQGRYQEARRAAERAARSSSAPHVQALLSQLVRAERTGLDVRVSLPAAVELSIYHLLSDDGSGPYGSLLTVEIASLRPESAEVRVEAELVGFSQRTSKQVTVLGGTGGAPKATSFFLTPALDKAQVLGVSERQRKTLRLRVTRLGSKDVILEEEQPLTVLPRDYVAYSRPSADDPDKEERDDNGHGVLITPRGRWVDGVIAAAKALHPKKELSGPFAGSLPQVRALYDYLKGLGVSYAIGSPSLVRQKGEPMVQRLRPPGAALELRAAQCWEGTNVFASVLEALKLEPMLFKVPGHILIGWSKNAFDTEPGAAGSKYYLLETTVIGRSTFDEARAAATRRLIAAFKAGYLKNGLARFIDVSALRHKGIVPQPWDD